MIMPTSLLALLKAVPWSDVLGSAPLVAQGAKKLWTAVANKPAPSAPADSAEAASPAALEARLAAMEQAHIELHEQMLASSALLTALADQNALLIKSLKLHRLQIRWLILTTFVLCAGLIASLIFPALHSL